jgi:hypothetical protein
VIKGDLLGGLLVERLASGGQGAGRIAWLTTLLCTLVISSVEFHFLLRVIEAPERLVFRSSFVQFLHCAQMVLMSDVLKVLDLLSEVSR